MCFKANVARFPQCCRCELINGLIFAKKEMIVARLSAEVELNVKFISGKRVYCMIYTYNEQQINFFLQKSAGFSLSDRDGRG